VNAIRDKSIFRAQGHETGDAANFSSCASMASICRQILEFSPNKLIQKTYCYLREPIRGRHYARFLPTDPHPRPFRAPVSSILNSPNAQRPRARVPACTCECVHSCQIANRISNHGLSTIVAPSVLQMRQPRRTTPPFRFTRRGEVPTCLQKKTNPPFAQRNPSTASKTPFPSHPRTFF
jgi:hypothetical protein